MSTNAPGALRAETGQSKEHLKMHMDAFRANATDFRHCTVHITPPDIARRRQIRWSGVELDAIELSRREPFEYEFQSRRHMLIVSEHQARHDGETLLQGLPKSRLREFSHTLSLVPSDHYFSGWQKPRLLNRVNYFYIDPTSPLFADLGFSQVELKPRLFFFDQDLWQTALKLKAQAAEGNSPAYAEALALVLAHELMRLDGKDKSSNPARGGLASWQQKKVVEYVEEHLHENILLTAIADIAQLSPYHFARAFKQTFGEPPHRYLTGRRILRAKELLANPARTVTEIGRQVGFRETSSFTAAFRRAAGLTPSAYRRQLT
jgi:AraC family transcriptional regulator